MEPFEKMGVYFADTGHRLGNTFAPPKTIVSRVRLHDGHTHDIHLINALVCVAAKQDVPRKTKHASEQMAKFTRTKRKHKRIICV